MFATSVAVSPNQSRATLNGSALVPLGPVSASTMVSVTVTMDSAFTSASMYVAFEADADITGWQLWCVVVMLLCPHEQLLMFVTCAV